MDRKEKGRKEGIREKYRIIGRKESYLGSVFIIEYKMNKCKMNSVLDS